MSLIDWIIGGVFLFAVVGISVQWHQGAKHRRQAKEDGKEIHHLWWHVRAAARELSDADKQKRAARKKTEDRQSRLASTVADNQAAAKEAMRSSDWKKQVQKARKARSKEKRPPSPKQHPASQATDAPKIKITYYGASIPERFLEPDVLLFAYEDTQGNISSRAITNWKTSETYVRGFCLEKQATRTFKIDRIIDVYDDTGLFDEAYQPTPPPTVDTATPSKKKGAPEILFTGFDAKSRRTLEATAKAAGFTVRKTVTKNLDFLVTGPRPSQTKLGAASAKSGCSVLDKEGFLWALATGEIKEKS